MSGGGALAAEAAANIGTFGVSAFYNHWLNQKTWGREDTAVQRHMADLRAAGLNPTLAAGGSGAPTGHATPMGAPPEINQVTKQAELDAIRHGNENLLLTGENLKAQHANLEKDLAVKDQEITESKARAANTAANTAATTQETANARRDAELMYSTGMTRKPGYFGQAAADVSLTAKQFMDGLTDATKRGWNTYQRGLGAYTNKQALNMDKQVILKTGEAIKNVSLGKMTVREAKAWLDKEIERIMREGGAKK